MNDSFDNCPVCKGKFFNYPKKEDALCPDCEDYKKKIEELKKQELRKRVFGGWK